MFPLGIDLFWDYMCPEACEGVRMRLAVACNGQLTCISLTMMGQHQA
jgi:hypothetical protein